MRGGKPPMSTKVLLSFISTALLLLAAQHASAMCGDVTGDNRITSSDALSVLREAVGDDHPMMCDMCPGGTTTTLPGATTTTLAGATTTTVPGSGTFTL